MSGDIITVDEKYIEPEKLNKTLLHKFSVEKPTKFKWIFIGFVSLIFNVIWLILTPIDVVWLFIIIGIVVSGSLFFWSFLGRWIVKKLILNSITAIENRLKNDNKNQKRLINKTRFLFLRTIGLRMSENYDYYLEQMSFNINLNKLVKLVRTKIRDVMISSLGIGFLIVTFIKPFIQSWEQALLVSSIILLSTPALVGLIIPSVWLLKDARIKYMKNDFDSISLSEDIKKGFLNRFLGLSGVLAGINFLVSLLPENPNLNFGNTIFANLLYFLIALLILLIIAILLLGVNFLVSILYLAFYHENRVNELRSELAQIIPIAQTEIQVIKEGKRNKI